MAVHNGERFLREAVDSLLRQSFGDFELLTINDGSRDATPGLLQQYAQRDPRLVVIENPTNLGLTPSLNRGLEQARGEFIARMDADDIAEPNRFELQAAFLRAHPEVGLLASGYHVADDEGRTLRTLHPGATDTEIRWDLLFANTLCHSTTMFRASLIRRYGLRYNPAKLHVEDYDLWSRMLTVTRGANLFEPLVRLRQHPGSVSSVHAEAQMRAAAAIARDNMRAIDPGLDLTEEDARRLRPFRTGAPADATPADLQLARLPLRLFRAMMAQPGIDAPVLRRVRRAWIRKTILDRTPDQWSALRRSGLLGGMFQADAMGVMRAILRRACGGQMRGKV